MVASNLRFNNLAKYLPFGREDSQQKTGGIQIMLGGRRA